MSSCPRMEDGRPRKTPNGCARATSSCFAGATHSLKRRSRLMRQARSEARSCSAPMEDRARSLHHAGAAVWFKGVEHVTFETWT